MNRTKRMLIGWMLGMVLLCGCQPTTEAVFEEPAVSIYDRLPYIVDNDDVHVISMAGSGHMKADPLRPADEEMVRFFQLIYMNLIELDERQRPIPSIAREWEVSNDGLLWTVKLYEDIRFHDGRRVTANDVRFTIEQLLRYGYTGPYFYHVSNIRDMQADGQEIFIHLYKPDGWFPWKLQFPIVSSRSYHDGEIGEWTGTGAFAITNFEQNHVVAQSLYHNGLKVQWIGLDAPAHGGASLLLPSYHGMATVAPEQADMYMKRTDLYRRDYIGTTFDVLVFNTRAGLLRHVNVRNAISHFLDVDEIVKKVYEDRGVRSDEPIHPDSFLAEWSIGAMHAFDPSLGHELMQRQNLILLGGNYHIVHRMSVTDEEGETRIYYRYEPVAFEIGVYAFDQTKIQVANEMKRQLEKEGIRITVREMSIDRMENQIRNASHQMLIVSFEQSAYPNMSHVGLLGSLDKRMHQDPGYINPSNVQNLTFERLIEQAKAGGSLSELIEGYNRIQYHVKEQVPYIGLAHLMRSCIYSRSIDGAFAMDAFSFFREPNTLLCRP